MMYKITYYSYDKEDRCYYEEFSKMGTSEKDEIEMQIVMDVWNNDLMRQGINGRVSFSKIDVDSLDEYSVYDLIRDISEL